MLNKEKKKKCVRLPLFNLRWSSYVILQHPLPCVSERLPQRRRERRQWLSHESLWAKLQLPEFSAVERSHGIRKNKIT